MKAATAVVGVGFVGRAHVEALRRLGCDGSRRSGSSAERGREACESLGLARAYESLEELAADPKFASYIFVRPIILHFEQAGRLLRAGKHVLCEKPLALVRANPGCW